MASFHHHFCFAQLKPLIFTWHHLNPMKRRTRAGKEHICFAGKSPRACAQAEARPKSCTQDQARNIQQNMGHITSMCCGHLLHRMEKPSQQILGYAVPSTMATNRGAGFLGSWDRRRSTMLQPHRTAPQKGTNNGAFWVWVLQVSSANTGPSASCPAQPGTNDYVCCCVLTLTFL